MYADGHASSPRDKIPYEAAESLLFNRINPEAKLIALDHAHHFGADVADMVNDVAEAIYPKAVSILHDHGHSRVFGHKHLWDKCLKWAAWWCRFYARRYTKRAHTQYTAEKAAIGRSRSIEIREAKADDLAAQAQYWRATGKSIEDIARRIGRGCSTVYRLLKRKVKEGLGRVFEQAKPEFSSGRNSVPRSIEYTTVQETTDEKKPDPSSPADPPEPDEETVRLALQEFADRGSLDFAEIGRKKSWRA